MASSKEYLEFVLEQLAELDKITYRAMMGEYIIYYRGKIVGGIYDDRLLVKPIKSGLIADKDVPKVVFTNQLKEKPRKEQIEFSPNLFQAHIKKLYDERVTMVGEKAFAVLIDSQSNVDTLVDWRRGECPLKHTKRELPDKVLKQCISLLQTLNLRFGAIDFILDKNSNFIFLEINPNGQWAWIEKQTEYQISNEIVNLLEHEYF